MLPAPAVVPLGTVDPYRPPSTDAVEPETFRLTSLPWVAWTVMATVLGGLCLVVGFAGTQAPGVFAGGMLALPCLLLAAWGWYTLVFAPRLALDAEGLRFTTYGLWRDELSVAWAEIHDVRLIEKRSRSGQKHRLHLTVRSHDARAGSTDGLRSIELDLGMARSARVDRALRRYCPRQYSWSHP